MIISSVDSLKLKEKTAVCDCSVPWHLQVKDDTRRVKAVLGSSTTTTTNVSLWITAQMIRNIYETQLPFTITGFIFNICRIRSLNCFGLLTGWFLVCLQRYFRSWRW